MTTITETSKFYLQKPKLASGFMAARGAVKDNKFSFVDAEDIQVDYPANITVALVELLSMGFIYKTEEEDIYAISSVGLAVSDVCNALFLLGAEGPEDAVTMTALSDSMTEEPAEIWSELQWGVDKGIIGMV